LNTELRQHLHDAFVDLTDDDAVRVIVLTGNDEAFAAGADLNELAPLTPIEATRRRAHRLVRPIAECPKPVISAIRGYALGGGLELALLTDIVVVGDGAMLGLPEVRVGLMPGSGGTQRVTRAIGKYRTMLLALTGEMISGAEAARMGLASKAVPDAEVVDTALGIARRIAQLPPLGVQQIKDCIVAGMDASLATGLALERKAFGLLFSTEDQKEGTQAFLDKRKPSFKGR
jgi:enoyl-CoA hydratase/carnithine racemase